MATGAGGYRMARSGVNTPLAILLKPQGDLNMCDHMPVGHHSSSCSTPDSTKVPE